MTGRARISLRRSLRVGLAVLFAAWGSAVLAQPASPRDLGHDEALGGHTLARHVARTDAQLHDRLNRERQISAASTYADRATAERVVGEALAASSDRIRSWSARGGRRPNLVLRYRGGRGGPIGRSLERGDASPRPCHDAVVVLRWDDRRGGYVVLTSYPEARR